MSRRRSGFTLIELLVVISIMGMLMAMIFPAFGGILETVRRTGCKSKMDSIVKAINVYESGASKGFPGLVESGRKIKKYPNGTPMTWATSILNQMQETALHKSWYDPAEGDVDMKVETINSYVCASDTRDDNSMQQLSYVINAGAIEDGKDPNIAGVSGNRTPAALTQRLQSNGIAFNRYSIIPGVPLPPRVTKSGIQSKKGLQYMALLSENLQAWNWGDKRIGEIPPTPYDDRLNKKNAPAIEAQAYTGFVWNGLHVNLGTEKDPDPSRIDKAPDGNPIWARPSSNHPNGVNMIFCDGSNRFITNSIARHVYQSICMTDPKKAVGNDLNELVRKQDPTESDF
jgi:prepilin-type N-terminal cleavage/methylation domain-containing protein/prepilin-type processing-associated H-X9-DG protein